MVTKPQMYDPFFLNLFLVSVGISCLLLTALKLSTEPLPIFRGRAADLVKNLFGQSSL